RQSWGQSFVRVPGELGKFSHLLSWSRLNEILEFHHLRPGKTGELCLFQDGKEIPPNSYLDMQDGLEPRLKAHELTNLLAAGATLIVNEMDDLEPAVRDLAVGLERVFRIRIVVNMYAS